MSGAPAAFCFLPWLRRGLAAGDSATLDGSGRLALAITVGFNDDPALAAIHSVSFYGPGDVLGLDPRSVIRTYPRAGEHDAQTTHFPLVEIDQADLPWRYSPVAAAAQDRLLPWLCLLAVRDDELTLELPTRERPSAIARLGAGTPLPPFDQAWAWAHVQVSGTHTIDGAGAASLYETEPHRLIARLMCPRRLAPSTAYTALLVPTFERGRRAGLKLSQEGVGAADPAFGAHGPIDLPVYFQFRFTTGGNGDFDALVRRLLPNPLPATLGGRLVTTRGAGAGLPDPSTRPLLLEGALVSPDFARGAWEPNEAEIWQAAVAARMNQAADLAAAAVTTPWLAPPFYGALATGAQHFLPGGHPGWLMELNGDPMLRAIAGLGTEVVRRERESLLAGAWQQIAGTRELSEELRFAHVARWVTQRLHARHIASATVDRLLALTAPILGAVRMGAVTAQAQVVASAIVRGTLEPQLRRVARPFGALGRRQQRATVPLAVVSKTSGGALRVRPPAVPSVMATLARAALPSNLGIGELDPIELRQMPGRAGFHPRAAAGDFIPRAGVGAVVAADVAVFRRQAAAVLARIHATPPLLPEPGPAPLEALLQALTQATHPQTTIDAAYRKRLQRPDTPANQDALAPLAIAPRFDQPMAEPLAALSSDDVLPGIASVPANTVGGVVSNPRFVEAFLIGANHALAQALFFEDFPVDRRGTYFRQFWNARGSAPPSDDIPPLVSFGDAPLGKNASPSSQTRLVLLVRGDVLRRYPNLCVSAVGARFTPRGTRLLDDTREVDPLFSGWLGADMGYFGFALTVDQAVGGDAASGDAGWFFVLAEHPSAPRFGLAAEHSTPVPGANPWASLAWPDLSADPTTLATIEYIDLNTNLPDTSTLQDASGARWHADRGQGATGARASDLAYITLRRPLRVAFHGSSFLHKAAQP